MEGAGDSSLLKQGSKARKNYFLNWKIFYAHFLKNILIFAAFVRRLAESRWAGIPPDGRQSVGISFKIYSDFFQQTPP